MPRYLHDDYDTYADQFDPMNHDRQARRKRKFNPNHKAKKADQTVLTEIAETEGLEGGFKTTYVPGLFEEGWLLDSIRGFYEMGFITDVLGRVKGGKEASVYRCQAHDAHGGMMVAAKVYRPRYFRNLRNDAFYREGRAVLDSSGNAVKPNDHRIMRALGKKTGFGQQIAHTSWLMYEYNILNMLHAAGASVPKPYSTTENAILMSYYGDEVRGASTLIETSLATNEAVPLFNEVIRTIEIMLKHGYIHGDLSAYNILYHEGKIVLIDFPQVVETRSNNARFTLQRDVTRVCDYFALQGVRCNPREILQRLTNKYLKQDIEKLRADLSRSETSEDGDD
jgi:RIO kinase 1